MSGLIEHKGDAREYFLFGFFRQGNNTLHHGGHVSFAVERDLFLPHGHDFQGVLQENPGQLHGHGGHINRDIRIGP